MANHTRRNAAAGLESTKACHENAGDLETYEASERHRGSDYGLSNCSRQNEETQPGIINALIDALQFTEEDARIVHGEFCGRPRQPHSSSKEF